MEEREVVSKGSLEHKNNEWVMIKSNKYSNFNIWEVFRQSKESLTLKYERHRGIAKDAFQNECKLLLLQYVVETNKAKGRFFLYFHSP